MSTNRLKTSFSGWLVIVILHIFILNITSQTRIPRKEIALFLNKEPITKEELRFFAQRNRHIIIREFRRNYGLDYHINFWEDKSKGVTPTEVLQKMTIDTAITIKIQLLMAKNYGIIRNASFQSIRMNMEAENKRRTEAIAKKLKFVGPEQFDMNSYFDYFYSNLVIRLKDYMVANSIIKTIKSESKEQKVHHNNLKVFNFEKSEYENQVNSNYKQIVDELLKKTKIKTVNVTFD